MAGGAVVTSRPLRIAFVSGPANIDVIYEEWKTKKRQEYFGTDYMKQFLDLASDLGADSYVITWYGDQAATMQQEGFKFQNRPISTASGIHYHVALAFWHLRLLPSLLRFKPDMLLLTGNQDSWWLLAPMRWTGTRTVISYHSVIWPKFAALKPLSRLYTWLNKHLVLRHARAIVVTSSDIREQVEIALGTYRRSVPVIDHLPSYKPEQFAAIAPPTSPLSRPFRTVFIGRIEDNKGVFDVFEIARRLHKLSPGQYAFDICGSGTRLDELQARVSKLGLQDMVAVHGQCGPERLRETIGAAHVSIVPTRSDFIAGFEMTCAEAILAGRPLITSAVCPALPYLRPATIEVAPDDVDGYHDAIVRLSKDRALYERLQQACAPLQAQFYDRDNSWYAAMRRAMEQHLGQVAPSS